MPQGAAVWGRAVTRDPCCGETKADNGESRGIWRIDMSLINASLCDVD